MSDIVEDLIFMHNDFLTRGEDHDKVLDRVDGWMTDHLTRFKGPPGVDPYAVSTEQERIAVAFEQRGLNTDLSRKMLLVIQGRRNVH